MHDTLNWKKYIFVFCITLAIFLTALFLSNFLNDKKLQELESIQNKISLDILSSETQFALLEDLSCEDVKKGSILSDELASLADRLDYSDKNFGETDDLRELKKYYSLLEIKDYLLMKQVTARCGVQSEFILYFYTTSQNCSECTKQGYALTTLRNKYPELRVYSFDYGLDLSAIGALISIYKVEDTKLPALVVNSKLYTGFKSAEEIEAIVPELVEAKRLSDEEKAKVEGGIGTNQENQETPPKPEIMQ